MLVTSKNAVQLIEVVTNLLEDAGNKEKWHSDPARGGLKSASL